MFGECLGLGMAYPTEELQAPVVEVDCVSPS